MPSALALAARAAGRRAQPENLLLQHDDLAHRARDAGKSGKDIDAALEDFLLVIAQQPAGPPLQPVDEHHPGRAHAVEVLKLRLRLAHDHIVRHAGRMRRRG